MDTGTAYGPLVRLGRKLARSPPRLSSITTWLGEAEFYQEFVGLVEKYLPDMRQILGQPNTVPSFTEAFSERYFPLEEVGSLGNLVRFIPVEVYGWDEEDYHNLPEEEPRFLLPSLFVAELEDLRIPALEAAGSLVPRRLLRRLGKGYPLPFLERVLGTPYEGLMTFAQVLCHETGCLFWDLTPLNIRPPSSGGLPYQCDWSYPSWCPTNVKILTREWKKGARIREKVDSFLRWFEEDPAARFGEVLGFLERRRVE